MANYGTPNKKMATMTIGEGSQGTKCQDEAQQKCNNTVMPSSVQSCVAAAHCHPLRCHPLLNRRSASTSSILSYNVTCNKLLLQDLDCGPTLAAANRGPTQNTVAHDMVNNTNVWHDFKRNCSRQQMMPSSPGLVADASRPLSAPGIPSSVHRRCHCVACCSCSPSERLSGTCPAFTFPSTTTPLLVNRRASSLDSGLNRNIADAYPGSFSAVLSDCSKTTKSVGCPNTGGIHKSSSLPLCCSAHLKYYTVGISFDDPLSVSRKLLTSTSADALCPFIIPSLGLAEQSIPDPVVPVRHEVVPSRSVVSAFLGSKVPPLEYQQKLRSITSWFEEFDNEQRNILLSELLAMCEQPQIHFLSVKMAPGLHSGCPQNCEDRLGWLPDAMSFKILSYLDPATLCRCSSVSQRWYELANEPSLWRRLSSMAKWRLSRSSEQKQLLRFTASDGHVNWKGIFAERFRLQNNWLKGRCNVRTFEGHTQGISCLQFDDTRIVSGSSDKTIKLWNIRTNSPWAVQTLVGHSGTVRCLHLEGNRLVSGSTDRTIKVWDLSSQQSWASIACKVTMVGHTDTVRCLQVDDEKVISGSYDKTLKVWDIKTGLCRSTLRGHEAAVLCVQFDNEKIISGSCDKTIKVWTFSGTCVVTLQGHQDAVTCLQFDDTRIISGSIDCTLRFWDLRSRQSIKVIDWKASEGHTGVVRCLQADSWRVVSASDDRTIKVWSLETGQRLVTLRNHTDGVTCLQFSDAVIVSGSYDKTVKLWDFSCC